MQFELSIFQLVTICAIVNGIVFSILVLDKRENRSANRFFSLFIVSMCLTFTPYMLDPSIWHTYNWLAWMPFSLSYWIGPSFYFYVRTLTRSDIEFSRTDLWHFTPLILNYLHSIYHAVVGESNPYPGFHHLAEILESMAILSIIIYLIVSYRMTVTYQDRLYNRVSSFDLIDLQWIKRISIILVISFVLIFIFLVISSAFLGKQFLHQWNQYRAATLLFYAATLYWLSINGFRQAQVITIPRLMDDDNMEKPGSEIIRQLQKVMTERHLYLNPQFSLSDLSRAVGIAPRIISESINQELGINFYRFVNMYRVQEVEKKLLDPRFAQYTIMSIALDAGFNSKASFNRVFKAYTGYTPKQYQAKKVRST